MGFMSNGGAGFDGRVGRDNLYKIMLIFILALDVNRSNHRAMENCK
jgi:hypothetical protein